MYVSNLLEGTLIAYARKAEDNSLKEIQVRKKFKGKKEEKKKRESFFSLTLIEPKELVWEPLYCGHHWARKYVS